MPTLCFMVERTNAQTTTHPACDKLHGENEPCNENKSYESTVYDIARVDTGEVIAAAQSWFHGMPAGAMWWSDIRQDTPPTGPEDWPATTITAEERDRRRAAGESLKGVTHVRTDNEPRQPSHIFANGPHLIVMTPGSEWNIDSRASNCGLPYDYAHRCWIRHGEPPLVTVDKAGGATCTAGAGSIQAGSYHGFLTGGELT